MILQNHGMYFEEFEVGQKIVTVGRTITEADISIFTGLSGDYNRIHTDAEFCKNTPLGQRMAHGLMVLAMATGLAWRTGIMEGTALAFREISDWRFLRPVFPGDTVHAVIEIMKLKGFPRSRSGAVTMDMEVRNQRDELTMKGLWNVLVASKVTRLSDVPVTANASTEFETAISPKASQAGNEAP
jgi:acyl dehydratase